jgi:GNAT superfamily N-acetyltransferase
MIPLACRPLAAGDRAALAGLLGRFLDHYRESSTSEQLTAVIDQLLAPGPPFTLVAAGEQALMGAAFLNPIFPADGLTTALYLKDLYVVPEVRRRGVGLALLRACATFALAQGYSRLDWTTGADHAAARALYDRLAPRQQPKIYYRLETEALRRCAAAGR